MTIVELSLRPQFLERILDWFCQEWPKPGQARERTKERIYGGGAADRPPITLVLESEATPIGFATLVTWEGGRAVGRLHWIDAVYVDPEQRRQGLASRLITAVEEKAAFLGITEVFALTDLPGLYEKLRWIRVEEHAARTQEVILRKILR